ncbi:hypothetical protein [Cerasicoccus maritimus]|uniref:hypothetical protein n=1 Tax=Cerasicoccus maritimus TaxID=490089 RepID=UPI00285273C8|nr:hypothetical protein [Cerasicoccus maritimus]
MNQFQKDWALFLNAKDGDIERAKELIAEGANPNFVQPKTGRLQPHQLSSVLCRAIGHGHKEFIEFLFDNGAVIPETKEWQKKVGYAAQCAGRPDILILLISYGLPVIDNYQEWADNEGHLALKEYLDSHVGPRTIQYDIDKMLEVGAYQFVIDFCGQMPQYYDVASSELYEEEIVVRDVGEFLLDTGSGFTSMYFNGHFDTFDRALAALSQMKESLAFRALREVRSTLVEFGYPNEPEASNQYDGFLDEARREELQAAFERLDAKYFHGEDSQSLWHNLDFIDRTHEYVKSNIEIFRRRNA